MPLNRNARSNPGAQLVAQGANRDYQLHTIGWSQFQDLALTALGIWLEQPPTLFNKSKDGGRDGSFHLSLNEPKAGFVPGKLTVQCKHFSSPTARLTAGILKAEVQKWDRLFSWGATKNYVLATNARLSSADIQEFETFLKSQLRSDVVRIFDGNWLTMEIANEPKLRRLVPRVYGLGDLSYVLDERATAQTKQVLSSMQYELQTMVHTDAYRRALKALDHYHFVMLVGEPASGKSTIAATLAMGVIDQDHSVQAFKVRSPSDFLRHYNPDDPRQFFWVDDAFGPTQFQRDLAEGWARCFRELNAAIKQSAYVVFTSRDYIYGSARAQLLLTSFPLMRTAEVVIDVNAIAPHERVAILYNHIKQGNQGKHFKTSIKPFLQGIARDSWFIPEVARRLGDSFYTGQVELTYNGLHDFVRRRGDYLVESIEKADEETRATLLALFMSGGYVDSPVTASPHLAPALEFAGLSIPRFRAQLKAFDGSLVMREQSGGRTRWTFRHPTLRDAIALVVASDTELFEAYLQGTTIDDQINEIRCRGVTVTGARVVLPIQHYEAFWARLRALDTWKTINFLADRADDRFMQLALTDRTELVGIAAAWPGQSSARAVVAKAITLGLINNDDREAFVEGLKVVTKDEPSAIALTDDSIRSCLSVDELEQIADLLRDVVIEGIDLLVQNWIDAYEDESDGDSYFEPLLDAIAALEEYYRADSATQRAIRAAHWAVDNGIATVDEMRKVPDESELVYPSRHIIERDPFSDVDE